MSNENKKWYEEEIEKTREKLQSRWKRQGETKVKFKIEPYVFDYDWSEYSVNDKKTKEDFAKILFDWKKKGKGISVMVKFCGVEMVLYSSGYTNGKHSEHYLMTLNAYAFWKSVGMFQMFEHPRGIGFWKINNDKQRLIASDQILCKFAYDRQLAEENGVGYLHDDFCCFKHWFDEEKILRSI